jgi:hypothetical protein
VGETKGEMARARDRPMGEKRVSGEWWVRSPRPLKISWAETPQSLAFLATLACLAFSACHVRDQSQRGLTVGHGSNAGWFGISVWTRSATGSSVFKKGQIMK